MDPIARMVAAGAAGAAGGGDPVYVDDVFSTFLYTGTASTQTITNGIDLSGEGGLVWIKNRNITGGLNHALYDTERGAPRAIASNSSNGQTGPSGNSFTGFTSSGFTLGADTYSTTNGSGNTYASWTFRKAPGFFDVVTYSGNGGVSGNEQQISHSLGSKPGMIFVKRVDTGGEWYVFTDVIDGSYDYSKLHTTNSFSNSSNNVPTSSVFNVGGAINVSGGTYVAYVFANDDQSFGTNSDEAIIKCGTYTGNGSSTGPVIDLGFEPQFLLHKRADNADNWIIMDSVRGLGTKAADSLQLYPNTNGDENNPAGIFNMTANGFSIHGTNSNYNANGEKYLYMAIRRPHKPPTEATEVFDVGLRSGSGSIAKTNSSILTDMSFVLRKDTSGEYNGIGTRMRGMNSLKTNTNGAELTGWVSYFYPRWDTMTGFHVGAGNGAANTGNLIDFSFQRASGFFDVAVYTGNGSQQTVSHNLDVVPELMINKDLTRAEDWQVYHKDLDNAYGTPRSANELVLRLNEDNATWYNVDVWNSTSPTSSVFSVGNSSNTNHNGDDYVMYLFASLDGISKVGSYTGTGAAYGNSVDVDCGFTAGARFVLIKRTDSGGDWYVWNSASGIVSGNDPYMLLNTTSTEVTNTDYIDPLNSGFTVTSSSGTLNTLNATYIFLAIA